jgi:hypothetical protein
LDSNAVSFEAVLELPEVVELPPPAVVLDEPCDEVVVVLPEALFGVPELHAARARPATAIIEASASRLGEAMGPDFTAI